MHQCTRCTRDCPWCTTPGALHYIRDLILAMSLQLSAVAISILEIVDLISDSSSLTSCLNSVKSAVCSITASRPFFQFYLPFFSILPALFLMSSCPSLKLFNSSSTILWNSSLVILTPPPFYYVLILYHIYIDTSLWFLEIKYC